MKKIICLVFLLIVLSLGICAFVWMTNYAGTGTAVRVTMRESNLIQDKIDDRYQALDVKLDRIEGKLDRLLKIAECPLPDGMRKAE